MKTYEASLAVLARNGDRDAFEQLVDLYKDKIYHLAYRMLGQSHEAEDVLQETFLRVFANLDKYDPNRKFSTWIYRIGNNLCIDRLRKRRKAYSLDAESGDHEGIDGYAMYRGSERSPEEQYVLSEMQLNVRNAIDKLPEKYKSVVVLRYLHDLSLQEISEVLDLPVTTIKTRVHRGREYLRQKLNDKLLL